MDAYNTNIDTSQKTRLMSCLISKCNQITQELNRRMMDSFSLSFAKYEVLVAVDSAEGGEITMSNLSRELLVSNANMTGMISRLQSDELVEKKITPSDRRIYSVELTLEGREVLEKAKSRHCQWIEEMTANIGNDDLGEMNDFLSKISNANEYI